MKANRGKMPADSRFNVRLLAPADAGEWKGALGRAGGGGLVHDWDFTEWAALGRGVPRRVVVETSNGDPAAMAVFIERRHRGMTQWRHATPATFGGVAFVEAEPREGHVRDVLAALGGFLDGRAPYVELLFPPAQVDVRALLWQGWVATPHYNYISVIDTEDALARAAENAVRRQHRKAASEGLELRWGREYLDGVLSLAAETRQRQGFPEWVSDDCFRGLVAGWHGLVNPSTEVFAVVDQTSGTVEAGAIVARHRDTVAYLLGASRQDGEGGSGAPSLLQIEATAECFRRWGAFRWDWVGANTQGVAQFKKKFRPMLEMGLRVTRRSGLGRLLTRG